MATPTDIQFAVPTSPEIQYPGAEAIEAQREARSEFAESRISLQDEQDASAPYINGAELYDAREAAVNAAQPSKVEANTFNPEAIYSFVEGAGARISGLRKHHVAFQDENFMSVLRNKSIN